MSQKGKKGCGAIWPKSDSTSHKILQNVERVTGTKPNISVKRPTETPRLHITVI